MGDPQNRGLGLSSDHDLKLELLGSKVATDAGLFDHRELDEPLGLTETVLGSL